MSKTPPTRSDEAPATATAPVHDPIALTHYIETRYHARHRAQLLHLAEVAEKVEAVHATSPHVPRGLSELLRRMIGEMEVHMKKEELLLFPAMRKGGAPGLKERIAAIRAEHDDQDAELAEIRRITGGPTLPENACRTWTALHEGIVVFITDLEEHTRLENDVLFPQFEKPEKGDG